MVRFKVITIWLFVALLCTATLSRVVNHLATQEVEKASNTYHAVQDRLDLHRQFVLALFHAQRAQRGYLLSGSEPYLEPYNSAMAQIPEMLAELKAGAVTYGTAHIYTKIAQLLTQYLDGLKTTLTIYKRGNVDAALDQVRTDKEKNLMDSIQALLSEAEKTKVRFLATSEASLGETLEFQKATESVSFMMIFLIGVVFLWQVKSRLLYSVNALKSHLSLLGDELGVLEKKLPEADLEAVRLELNSLIRRVVQKEQEVLQSREREIQTAVEAVKRQEEFGSVLAHELRTPLNTLIGTIDCEKDDGNWPNDEAHQRIDVVSRNLLELVNSSLDYQRISSGHYELEKEPFDAEAIVEELKHTFKPVAAAKHIELEIYSENLANKVLLGDAVKVKQVLMNLMANAMKFTSPGGNVRVGVVLRCINNNCTLTYKVVDTGVGIDSDKLDLIFEPFQQADSGIKRQFGGTGIGLTLSRKIAECMGGTLTVTSSKGVGSEFTFQIPIQKLAVNDAVKSKSTNYDEALDLRGRRLLMVEDHHLNAKINMKIIQRHFGCELDHVETGEAALRKITETGVAYDLILMDVNLGSGLSGLETSEILIRKLDKCPPIVALTAGVTEAQKQAVKDSGLVAILEKPFSIDQAEIVLRHCLVNLDQGKQVYLSH